MPRGRPRQFDEDAALSAALLQFWEKGLAATSLDELEDAMGMRRPSIYGAFGDKEALYRRALEMGMHEHDPIVRARLLYRAREALGYIPEDELPTRDELAAHIEAHPERFEREGRARYNHVFLSRSKRGESIAADASAMRETLDALGEMPPKGLGDPLPGLRAEQVATSSKVKSEYGAEVAAVVEEAVVGAWRGPASSVYGLHFIRVVSTEPRRVPPG